MSALLELDDLSVRLPAAGPVPLLDRVSLSLERGESLGVVGESGCGKSMAALAIMGLLPPGAVVSGGLRFDGQDLLAAPEAAWCALRGRRIGMVFQEPMTALNPIQRIGAQLAEGPRRHLRLGRGAAESEVLRLLDRVGLARISPDRYPHQLSGGQRQRVMIAMALACGPDLLLADEPTTALDMTIQGQILALLAELAAERRMALLLITHDLGVVARHAARTLVMYAGRVVETGPTPAVFARMAHPYTHGLFAASPHAIMAGGRRRLPTIQGQVPEPRARPPGCCFAPRCAAAAEDCRQSPPMLAPLDAGHLAACYHPRAAA